MKSARPLARSIGMRFLLGLAILATSTAAHAMGTDHTAELIAWNAVGSAALLRHGTNHDGDTTDGYDIVAIGEKTPTFVQTSGIAYVDDAHPHAQQIDQAACTKGAKLLEASLGKHGFRGVAIHAERCAQPARDTLVTVSAEVARAVSASWVALPMARVASARERATLDAIAKVIPDAKFTFPDNGEATLDVANSGRMIIALYTPGGGSPMHERVLVFVEAKAGYVALLED